MPVETITCPSSYDWEVDAKSPTKLPSEPLPYPRWTYILPNTSSSFELSPSKEADSKSRYSVWNPVLSTFLAINISPFVKPLAFFTDIVVDAAGTCDPVIVVEFAIQTCPPIALTDSFSNVVVLNVPLIRTFSNSAVPFPSDEIFQPFNPLAKSFVCKIPCGFIIRLPPSIEFVLISHPPIDAELNLANPSCVIDDDALFIFDGLPPIKAGVNIWSTDKSPLTVNVLPANWIKLLAALDPNRNPDDAVICPSDFKRSAFPGDLISAGEISNPAIEADLNIAKPWSDIEDDAFAGVAGLPLITAGVNILFADTDPRIVTLLVITPPSIKKLEAVISPDACIWYPEDDISNCPFDPEINCVAGLPKKNFSVCISNALGSVLNLKKLLALATISKPTPWYDVANWFGNADPENNKNPPLPVIAWLNPS